MMTGPVLLNNVDHADVRVRLGHGTAFGDAINQIELLPTEFEAAQRDYPIVLRRRDDGGWRAFALLGLDAQENLFLDGDRWRARYVPALAQRGPFSIGVSGEGGEPMIHVDLDHPRVSRSEGEPLFRDHGGNAPYLDHVARVLQVIYAGAEIAPTMFAAFEAAGLIAPVTLAIDLPDGRKYRVPDCHTIDAGAFIRLDAAALAALNTRDFLRAAVWLGSSLGNVARLIELKAAKDG
jgi:hypothetical protein